MRERPNERAARYIVGSVLGVSVRRFEDGTADRQVDAVIGLPDGDAALEVVADHEDAFNAQWDALEKVGHKVEVPSLKSAWSAQLSRSAKVKRVVERLPEIALTLEAAAEDPDADTQSTMDDMERLGIRMLYPLNGDASGYVNLHAEGWGGGASSEGMAEFVERVLAEAPDVRRNSRPTPARPSTSSSGPPLEATTAFSSNWSSVTRPFRRRLPSFPQA